MYARRDSLLSYFMPIKKSDPRRCRRLLMKWAVNNRPSCSKELILPACSPENHSRADFRRVAGKARHITPSFAPCKSIKALKLSRWSSGLEVPSYSSVCGILNLNGTGSFITLAENGGSVVKSRSKGREDLTLRASSCRPISSTLLISWCSFGSLSWVILGK